MAVIESLIRGADGLVRAANIRTSSGTSNRPITKLHPLQITATTKETDPPPTQTHNEAEKPKRPKRQAALKASQQVSVCIDAPSGPPEDEN
jgi:hypothetical protein